MAGLAPAISAPERSAAEDVRFKAGHDGSERCGWCVSALHQFDADAVRGRDVAQRAAADAPFQRHGKRHAFAAEFLAKRLQVALVHKAEMVGAPSVMAGEIG